MSAVDIVVRSHNDMPLIKQTLEAVRRQALPLRLLVMDNESTDGTAGIAQDFADKVINVPTGSYVPGKVLNQAMAATRGTMVVFLNSDCTPVDQRWLETLLAGFESAAVAAVFGRQMPRPDCLPLFAKDTEDTFGDGKRQANWKHCFSMASSAIRRKVWEKMPFNPALQYSEDIDWTWRARQAGYAIRYCPESKVYHSHNYTLRQWHRRQYGEGRADAAIFDWAPWERSWFRYSALPFAHQVMSDWTYAVRNCSLQAFFHSPALRFAQMTGRGKGFREGFAN
jgi:rhamnosyltransferase